MKHQPTKHHRLNHQAIKHCVLNRQAIKHDGVNERGALAVEAAIVAVFLILFIVVINYVYLVTSAGGRVADAAGEAARAAAQADATRASSAAQDAATNALAGWCTTPPTITMNGPSPIGVTGAGQLAVTVTCTVDLSSSGATGLPGTRTMTQTRSAVVDRYRGDGA